MIAFVLLGRVPPLLALALAGMLYLSWIEIREEDISWTAKLWWYLFVGLFNIVGFIILRVAFATWRSRGRPALGRRS